MSLNFVDAFTFVFKEKNWCAKILIGAILFFFIKIIQLAMELVQPETMPMLAFESNSIMSLIYIGAILLLCVSLWMHAEAFGYIITTIGRYMKSEEDPVPDWDEVIGKTFGRGLKLFVAIFVILAGLSLLGAAAYTLFFILIIFAPIFAGFIALLTAFITVYIGVMAPALLMAFCEEYRFLHAFNFVRARQIALQSFGNYVLMLLMLLATIIITTVIIVIFFHVKVGIIVLPPICFYLFIVHGNFIGQYYKKYVAKKNSTEEIQSEQ